MLQPYDPMLANEFIEPMLKMDSVDPMLNIDSTEQNDSTLNADRHVRMLQQLAHPHAVTTLLALRTLYRFRTHE